MSEVLVLHHGERSFHPYSWPPHSQGGLAEPRRNPGLGTRTVLQVALSLFFLSGVPDSLFRAGG